VTGTAATLSSPVDGSWAQTPVVTFSRSLTGADRVWEVVTESPAITIPRAGVWVVSYQARGVAALPAAGAAQGIGVVAGLYKDGVLIGGSEVMAAFQADGGSQPATQVQATGSRQFVHRFTAGQTVQLAAYRIGQTGQASVVSNGDGRCYVTAHWIGPFEDGPT
jgi:hypothetical protein